MTYKIAVCDDQERDREYVASLVKTWADEKNHAASVSFCASAEDFLFHYEDEKNYDVLLLDIEMKDMDGVALAKKIRQTDQNVQIVFITGFPDFMAEGYEVSALHYLMKPVSGEKLSSVLDKAVGNLKKQERRICVTFDHRTEFIPLREIIFVEAQKQYVVIHTENGEYRMKVSLSTIEKELDEYFFKCQRSFIINLCYVKRINGASVDMKHGANVPISRGMAQTIGKEMIRLF